MTSEELMKPRYKVIADYPGATFEVGIIINTEDNLLEQSIIKYPHLFRKLEWWEEREEKDMPEYVKHLNGEVYKLSEANERYDGGFMFDRKFTEHHVHFNQCLPATKEEYDTYIQSQK